MRQCPKCHAQVSDTAKFCIKCGFPIQQFEEEQANQVYFCPQCGTQFSGGRFCPECGHNIDVELGGETVPGGQDSEIDDITVLVQKKLTEKRAGEQAENAARAEYDGKIVKARAFCIRGKYEEAREIYDEMIEADPVDMNGYIGLIRLSTKNFTAFEGAKIEDDIRIAKQISGKEDIGEYDADYADYAVRRAKYFADKAEAERKAEEEAERKAKEEAERKAKEEAERKAREIARNFDIENGVLKKYKGKGGSVIIPDGVTSIGHDAFRECSGLTSVTIPNSVTSIGHDAFRECSGLTSVTIPNSVTFIMGSAFRGCSALTSVTIPSSVTSIEGSAFSYCSDLTSITVEASNTIYHSENNCLIETKDKKLIAGCKNSVIPSDGSVTSIGDSAFCGCSGLTSVTIPNSVTSIGAFAFDACSDLTSVTIPNSVTSIRDWAFHDCDELTSVSVPKDCTISRFAFPGGCTVHRR